MTDDRHSQLVALFLAAADLQGPRRDAFLDRACGGDTELRSEIEALLVKDRQRAPLDAPVLGGGTRGLIREAVSGSPAMPTRIGQYEVLAVLGEGGMGTVYKARQFKPDRLVALKVIKSGRASRSVIRRFQYEAEILGRLQHPGIAQIFEAGSADTGDGLQPFLAMELIDGLPLMSYIRRHEPGTCERMRLFSLTCTAVHHAHQQGVIHRDLKPGNILVTKEGQPKILDFGVARAVDSTAGVTTLQTSAGGLIGTIAYMSPEQVAGKAECVDARSDIYALGVIAFQLLAGLLPYKIDTKTIAEAARVIQEQEPSPLGAVRREYCGDIQTIVGKALEKDKERRYESAAAMADDIDRYLRDEPILARPGSVVYQFHKFARRHTALVAGGVLAVLLLILGVAGTSYGLFRARNEAFKSNAVNEFFTEVLSSADPFSQDGGRETTLIEILDRAADRINDAFPNQPHIEAAVRMTLGKTYGSLARYDEAAGQLDAALRLNRSYYGDESELVVNGLRLLATNTVHRTADYEGAEELLREALAIQEDLTGTDDSMTVEILRDLAWTLKESKAYGRAVELYKQALQIQRKIAGDDNEMTAGILNDLGGIARVQGKMDEAERLYSESLVLFRRYVDETHPYIGIVESNLAIVLDAKGDRAGAEKRYRAAIKALSKAIGEQNPRVGRVVNNLAALLHEQNKLDQADAEYRRALEIFRASVGEDHADYASTLNNYAMLLWSLGKYDECASAYEQFIQYLTKTYGADYWHVHLTRFYLGETLDKLNRFEEAERLLINSRASLVDQFGPQDYRSQYATAHLIEFLDEHGQTARAAQYRNQEDLGTSDASPDGAARQENEE